MNLRFFRIQAGQLTDRTKQRRMSVKLFVPYDFVVPLLWDETRFKLRVLQEDYAELDYDAVMTSAEHIRGVFGPGNEWPSETMTIDQNRADLSKHRAEFEARQAFAYTVLSPEENTCLGCVYIYPAHRPDYDAAVFIWTRASEKLSGFDELLYDSMQKWIRERWPFITVAYPGRAIGWRDWIGLATKNE